MAGEVQPTTGGMEGRRRARLLAAFVRAVAERGYARTTPRDVADAAGLPEAAFHTCFTDLEHCFLTVYERATGRLRTRMDQAFHAAGPRWDQGFTAGLHTALTMTAAVPATARTCVLEVSAAGPRVQRARVRFLAGLRPLLTGPGAPVPDLVRDSIIGGIYGTVYIHVAAGRTRELPALLPVLTDFATGYFADSSR